VWRSFVKFVLGARLLNHNSGILLSGLPLLRSHSVGRSKNIVFATGEVPMTILHRFTFFFGVLLCAESANAQAVAADAAEPTPIASDPAAIPTMTASALAASGSADSVPSDLASATAELMLQSTDPSNVEKKLDIYGFSDFTYSGFAISKENRWNGYVNRYPGMGIGNLNVYLKGSLSERARSLVEIRFMYLPNGHSQIQPDGSVKYTDTKVLDPLELNRALKWGGIVIERAWVEYELHELATLRAGQFLTPYGIWNVDHGSPTIIGIRRPFVVTEAMLPEKQTGLELYGRRSLSNGLLGYHLTVSNGRGLGEEYQDRDNNKAVGGRLFGTTMAFGELTAGVSFYTAKRTLRKERWTLGADGGRVFVATDAERSRELGLAADVKWRWENLLAQAELVSRRRSYDDNARARLTDYAYPAFDPDNTRWGVYGLIGYRTPFAGIMPYLLFENATFSNGDISQARGVHVGLNYRPEPALVLKAEVLHAWFPGALQKSFGVDNLTTYALQVAWVF
jgi:hypothetical protein